MFTMTSTAAKEILAAAERGGSTGVPLRVAARQEADGSIGYGMGFDEQREDDNLLQLEGLQVLIGSRSDPLLQDTLLDFVELAPGEFEFIFARADSQPPEAPARACGSGGCGGCSQ